METYLGVDVNSRSGNLTLEAFVEDTTLDGNDVLSGVRGMSCREGSVTNVEHQELRLNLPIGEPQLYERR
jgi:hypothetical protein